MSDTKQDSEDVRGNRVATAVWTWLKLQQSVQFVPWVLNPTSELYDPAKVEQQRIRDELLSDLECVIRSANGPS